MLHNAEDDTDGGLKNYAAEFTGTLLLLLWDISFLAQTNSEDSARSYVCFSEFKKSKFKVFSCLIVKKLNAVISSGDCS